MSTSVMKVRNFLGLAGTIVEWFFSIVGLIDAVEWTKEGKKRF